MNCSEMCSILLPCFFPACCSLLILCAVVKYKMYEPPLLFQFGIHKDRWINSKLEVQELDNPKKCSLSDVLQVLEDFIVMGARKNRMHKSWWSLCWMHRSFRILFPSDNIVICYKRNAMFCSHRRQFSKDNSTFRSQTSNKSFCLDVIKKKHETSEVNFIVDIDSNKTNNNLSSLNINSFTFLEWHNILNE